MRHEFRRTRFIVGLSVVAVAIGGCADGTFTKSDMGNLVGGALGGFVGSQFGSGTGQLLGVALGTMAGSYLGGMIGEKLDARDQEMVAEATRNALATASDTSASWENPATGRAGTVMVKERYENAGQQCANLHYTFDIDGEQHDATRKGCLSGSNEWELGELELI